MKRRVRPLYTARTGRPSFVRGHAGRRGAPDDHHEAWGLTLDTVAPLEPARGLLEQQERELLCGGAQDFVFLSDDGVEMIDDVSHTEQARERCEEKYFLSSWLSYMIARLYTISHDCGRNIIIPGRPPLPNPSPLRPSKTHSAMRER